MSVETMPVGNLPVYISEEMGAYNILYPLTSARIRVRNNMAKARIGLGLYSAYSPSHGEGGSAVQFDVSRPLGTRTPVESSSTAIRLAKAGTFISGILSKNIPLLLKCSSSVEDTAVMTEAEITEAYLSPVYDHFGNITTYKDANSKFIETAVVISLKRKLNEPVRN